MMALERERNRPLSDEEKANIRCNVLMMRDYMPEFEEFVDMFIELDLCVGYRALGTIEVFDEEKIDTELDKC